MGIAGAGIATLLARMLSWWMLWIYQSRSKILASSRPTKWLRPLDRSICKQTIKIALPISGQLSLEFGAFAAAALLIGQFGSIALAAHQITISCAALTFMIPLGLSMAVTIRVGHAVGAGQLQRSKRIVLGAQACALAAMGLTALIFLTAGTTIASIFSPDPEVIATTAALLICAALFQIFDGAQVVSMGALRGIHDVNIPTVIMFISFWIVGIPLGAALAFASEMGATGLWYGLATGLGIAAVVLAIRLAKKLQNMTA